MDWFLNLEPVVQAAVIAASVAIVTALVASITTATNTLLGDYLARRAENARAKVAEREVYRRYADPLASSATSSYWRLREVFEKGGGGYLAASGTLTRFEVYKVRSTLYRLAALLGWIRGLRRELFFTAAAPSAGLGGLRDAIHTLEQALAEGGHVEIDRVDLLDSLWKLRLSDLPDGVSVREGLGREIDSVLKRHLHQYSAAVAGELPSVDRESLRTEVARVVHRLSGRAISPDVVRETQEQALSAMSVRECWIYRDWQSGIGDLMLTEAPEGPRRYDVVGFREFEQYCINGDEEVKRWIIRLYGLIQNLDVMSDDRRDARIRQLRGVHVAVAHMILHLEAADLGSESLRDATLTAVRSTVEWDKGPQAAGPRRDSGLSGTDGST